MHHRFVSHCLRARAPTRLQALACALLLATCTGLQAQVIRCTEAGTGRITYTNQPCPTGQAAVELQAPLSEQEIAQERAQAAEAIARRDAEQARLAQERQQALARQPAAPPAPPATGQNSAACTHARRQLEAILADQQSDPALWNSRSELARSHMELQCLGAAAYQELQQSRALRPGVIHRPWMGSARPPRPPRPLPSPPITHCNVFRCYDSRGGVHPIP